LLALFRPLVAVKDEQKVEFNVQKQALDALQTAAYKFIGKAHCPIHRRGVTIVFWLPPPSDAKVRIQKVGIASKFNDLVADENLRERIAAKTDPVRNLILSLAFGSLAARPPDQS